MNRLSARIEDARGARNAVRMDDRDLMAGTFLLPEDYWAKLEITSQDIEALHSHMFDV